MWVTKILLGIIGLSSGLVIAGGLFSFIVGLGLISKFADRTRTGKYVMLYEDGIACGGALGSILYLYQIELPFLYCLLPIFGLCSGIFVGCWAMSIAEIINIFPIFVRRIKLLKGIPYVIVGIALGKGFGTFLYFIQGWGN